MKRKKREKNNFLPNKNSIPTFTLFIKWNPQLSIIENKLKKTTIVIVAIRNNLWPRCILELKWREVKLKSSVSKAELQVENRSKCLIKPNEYSNSFQLIIFYSTKYFIEYWMYFGKNLFKFVNSCVLRKLLLRFW